MTQASVTHLLGSTHILQTSNYTRQRPKDTNPPCDRGVTNSIACWMMRHGAQDCDIDVTTQRCAIHPLPSHWIYVCAHRGGVNDEDGLFYTVIPHLSYLSTWNVHHNSTNEQAAVFKRSTRLHSCRATILTWRTHQLPLPKHYLRISLSFIFDQLRQYIPFCLGTCSFQ